MRTIEEIKADLEMLESFGINSVEMHDRLIGYLEELLNYRQAERDGRCVVLPCKVGDAIWKIKSAFSYFTKPMEDRVERIIIYKNEILVCCTSGAKFSIGSVGKAVFLTREEAEQALKGGATE
jgi:hypothetical protein